MIDKQSPEIKIIMSMQSPQQFEVNFESAEQEKKSSEKSV
jgi:hypothetical protein